MFGVLVFSIVNEASARDRFIRVVQWYLSVFHAGRRSSVAKKPYNPILGEIFRCYYDLPDDNGQEKVIGAHSTVIVDDDYGHKFRGAGS